MLVFEFQQKNRWSVFQAEISALSVVAKKIGEFYFCSIDKALNFNVANIRRLNMGAR